jgi:hypothetical protein
VSRDQSSGNRRLAGIIAGTPLGGIARQGQMRGYLSSYGSGGLVMNATIAALLLATVLPMSSEQDTSEEIRTCTDQCEHLRQCKRHQGPGQSCGILCKSEYLECLKTCRKERKRQRQEEPSNNESNDSSSDESTPLDNPEVDEDGFHTVRDEQDLDRLFGTQPADLPIDELALIAPEVESWPTAFHPGEKRYITPDQVGILVDFEAVAGFADAISFLPGPWFSVVALPAKHEAQQRLLFAMANMGLITPDEYFDKKNSVGKQSMIEAITLGITTASKRIDRARRLYDVVRLGSVPSSSNRKVIQILGFEFQNIEPQNHPKAWGDRLAVNSAPWRSWWKGTLSNIAQPWNASADGISLNNPTTRSGAEDHVLHVKQRFQTKTE